ncbi:hypothetical protein E4P41_07110 [Geodermatophilus sp. DF01-2]|uniref:hypothetical protein n=1 Tax=Geodermatophilus sp. DF01-2 TaxID=2559610 RepID=UPI0010744C6D|nr:hypothetical protein [Geodermatophilus sp. DF01_2]TFV62524.1 hypothetical protein E4P41_07110 [Geodermatophilus sp. DF01_2]
MARTVRALQAAPTAKEQYESLLEVADALSISAGAVAAAWLRSVDPAIEGLTSLRRAYDRGVTQGSWHDVLRAAAQRAVDTPDAVPGLSKVHRSARGRGSLLGNLQALVEERNRWAHGSAPRTNPEAAERLAGLLPRLEAALDQAMFLKESPWVVTRSSSYRSRERVFDVFVWWAMGDHPEFEKGRITSAAPLEDGRLYMLVCRERCVDLTPFVVQRHCEVCRSIELFHADRLPRGNATGVVLKSFGSGHAMTDDSLGDDLLGLGEQESV